MIRQRRRRHGRAPSSHEFFKAGHAHKRAAVQKRRLAEQQHAARAGAARAGRRRANALKVSYEFSEQDLETRSRR